MDDVEVGVEFLWAIVGEGPVHPDLISQEGFESLARFYVLALND